jgi:hypothetical protein
MEATNRPGLATLRTSTLQICNTEIGMAWVLELLDCRVRGDLETLPAGMKARFRRIVELIQNYGLEQMREPHVKHL